MGINLFYVQSSCKKYFLDLNRNLLNFNIVLNKGLITLKDIVLNTSRFFLLNNFRVPQRGDALTHT